MKVGECVVIKKEFDVWVVINSRKSLWSVGCKCISGSSMQQIEFSIERIAVSKITS